MRFLLRMTFWLGLVLVLLPSFGSESGPKVDIGTFDAIAATRAAFTDAGKFCERQPEACTFGSQIVAVIGYRAQAGAKILYEFLSAQFGPAETGAVDGPPKPAAPQNTLTPNDVAPVWRGPQSRPDPHGRPA